MKHLFIINGKIKGSKRNNLVLDIQKEYENKDYEIYLTTGPFDATRKVKEAIENSHDLRIYSCGGDGTIHEIVNGIYPHHDIELAILPLGTGNDFVKCFNNTKEDFLDLKNYRNPNVIYSDLLKSGDEITINTISIGFDAKVGDNVKYFKWIPGFKGTLPYYCSALISLIKPLGTRYHYRLDNQEFDDKYTFLVVTNGKFYGGGYQPCPDAAINDGIMNYCTIKEVKRSAVLKLAGEYKKGNHYQWPDLCNHGILETFEMLDDKEYIYSMDGEIRKIKNCKIELLKRQIKLCLPNPQE